MRRPGLGIFTVRFVSGTLLAFVMSSGESQAFDSATWCAWQRTWHGPYALAMPLRQYYVPRCQGRCDREVYAGRWGYADDGSSTACVGSIGDRYDNASACAYPPQAGLGFGPAGFARLGQIPNDLGIGVAQPTGSPQPEPPRR